MKKLIALVMSVILCVIAVGCYEDSSSAVDTAQARNIYTDENISVDFVKIANSIVSGNFELYVKAQNKTEKDVTLMLKDVTINGSMVEVGSGVPCDIIAGANRTHGFFGRLDLAGLTSAEEVTKITFKVWLVDENFSTIMTTQDLLIEI